VSPHCRVADLQALGHSPVIGAVDHELQDFLLARCQACQQLGLAGVLPIDLAAPRKGAGNGCGRDQRLARRSRTDRMDNLLASRRLEQVAARAGFDGRQ
jgi:hypothetical protein